MSLPEMVGSISHAAARGSGSIVMRAPCHFSTKPNTTCCMSSTSLPGRRRLHSKGLQLPLRVRHLQGGIPREQGKRDRRIEDALHGFRIGVEIELGKPRDIARLNRPAHGDDLADQPLQLGIEIEGNGDVRERSEGEQGEAGILPGKTRNPLRRPFVLFGDARGRQLDVRPGRLHRAHPWHGESGSTRGVRRRETRECPSGPGKLSRRSTLSTTLSSGTFPDTVVMPRTATSAGLARAIMMAMASSTPQSVSIRTFFALMAPSVSPKRRPAKQLTAAQPASYTFSRSARSAVHPFPHGR